MIGGLNFKTRDIPNKVCILVVHNLIFKLYISNRFDSSEAVSVQEYTYSTYFTYSCTLTAEDESNRFEIYSLKRNCVLQLCTPYSEYL